MKRRLTVLIVEDSDVAAIVLLRELCKKFDIVAERIDSSAAVAKVLGGQRWDVIIADLGLKGANREAVLDMLCGRNPAMPLIVLGDASGEEAPAALMQAGACAYVERHDVWELSMVVERAAKRERTPSQCPDSPTTITSFDDWVSVQRAHTPIAVDLSLG